jgi:hypothetical protein
MFATPRPKFVLAAAVPLTLFATLIPRIASAQPAVVLTHIQQQLTRVTGVPDASANDIDALDRALLAAQAHRPIQPERVNELGNALAAALGHGIYDEVLMQRLSEDMYAALNNIAITKDQAKLLAVDVSAVMQEAGVHEPDTVQVMAALRRVCPNAVAPTPTAQDASQNGEQAPKRALQVLSRGGSSD